MSKIYDKARLMNQKNIKKKGVKGKINLSLYVTKYVIMKTPLVLN
jgi:hypothetical protein